jgi:lipopolysaccharide transport system ATP-binding protein
MTGFALRLEGVGKRYRISTRGSAYGTLREAISRAARAPLKSLRGRGKTHRDARAVWALRDVSFNVAPGEVLGVIGRNGAGKSTLLKILSRITEPTEGRARVRGRIGSLLEVGTGFHPELTGRDNVFLNGSILGMDRRSVARRFRDIVEFAGVERFIDTPVKRYSSGMYMRLAFAVAAHLEPDILLLDEVLAVGDIDFQKKCVGTMQSVADGGRTVMIVSHDMGLVRSLCTRCVWLDAGRVRADGAPENVIAAYSDASAPLDENGDLERGRGRVEGPARITRIRLGDGGGRDTRTLRTGEGLSIELEVRAQEPIRHPWIGIQIRTAMSQLVFHCANREAGYELPPLEGTTRVRCIIPTLNLLPGRYRIDLILADMQHNRYDEVYTAAEFDVEVADVLGSGMPMDREFGMVYFRSRWDVLPGEGGNGGEANGSTSGSRQEGADP